MGLYVIQNGLGDQSVDEVSDQVLKIEQQAWNNSMAASLETIRHRLELFPNGLWRLFHNRRLVSYMYFIRIDSTKKYYSWNDYCAWGTCNNFQETGELLFGVSIGSIERHMGSSLFSFGMDLIINGYYKGINSVCMCSRIPSLSKVFKSKNNVPLLDLDDPVLMADHVVKMFMKKDCNPIALCKEGYGIDRDSLGYSLTMWRNI